MKSKAPIATLFLCVAQLGLMVAAYAGQSTVAQEFVRVIENRAMSIDARTTAIQKLNSSTIDETGVKSILVLIKTCEEPLIPIIANFLATKYPDLTFNQFAEIIVTGDPPRVAAILEAFRTFTVGSKELRDKAEKATPSIADALLANLDSSNKANKTFAILSLDAELVVQFIAEKPTAFKKLLIRACASGSSQVRIQSLSWIANSAAMMLIREEDIATLINAAGATEKEVSEAACRILTDVTHIKSDDKELDAPAWKAWWANSNGKFFVLTKAMEIAADKKQGDSDRHVAISQLSLQNIPADQFDKVFRLLKAIIDDNEERVEIRYVALANMAMATKARPALAPGIANDIAVAVSRGKMDFRAIELLNLVPMLGETPGLSAKLLEIVRNKQLDRYCRAYTGWYLSRTVKTPELARLLVSILRESAATDRRVIDGLKTIVGRDFGGDVDAWQKQIANIGKPEAVPANTQVKVPNVNRVKGLFEAYLAEADVRQQFRFNEQGEIAGITPGATFGVKVKCPEGKDAVPLYYGACIIDEAKTNAGENIASADKTRFLGVDTPLQMWDVPDWPLRPKKGTFAVTMHTVQTTEKIMGAISIFKSKFSIYYGVGLKSINAGSLQTLLGKKIEHPDLNAIDLFVDEVGTNYIVIRCSKKFNNYCRINNLKLVDEGQGELSWQTAKRMEMPEQFKVTLTFKEPLNQRMSLIIQIYDTVREEQVQVDYQGGKPVVPVKPPAPPDF